MRIVVRAFWFGSLLGFLFSLFHTYLNVRNLIGIQVDTLRFTFGRDALFFGFLGFFLLINLTLYAYSQIVFKLPKQLLLIPNSDFWTHEKSNRKSLNFILSNSSWVVAATLNFFLCYWLLVVKDENHFEGTRQEAVRWFFWPGILMVFSWIAIPIRLFIKNPNLLARTDGDA
jgi:hypothetical protein